eukprot:5013089-Prymnesium_polylepis.1
MPLTSSASAAAGEIPSAFWVGEPRLCCKAVAGVRLLEQPCEKCFHTVESQLRCERDAPKVVHRLGKI